MTGSTAGIGFAIARGLAEAGAKVVVNGRKRAGVDAAVVGRERLFETSPY
jgi:NAD(P)-dependent dehydrogenase (short-subunit alcohol dehydrogenase family)